MTAEPGTTSLVSLVLGTEQQPQPTTQPPSASADAPYVGASAPLLIRWTSWWDNPGSWDSYAVVTPDGPVLIDPVALTPEAEERLLSLMGGPPKAIVLTNDMHERDAYALREKWGAPLWGPSYGTPERGGRMDEGTPDHLYEHGDTLPGGLRVHKLDGGAFCGDSVLLWDSPDGKRVLFTGDAINGAFNSANPKGPHPRRSQPGLYLGAGPFYLERCKPEALKTSLRALLSERIDLICGAHGDPYSERPNEMLGRLLEIEWEPLFKEKIHPVVR